MLQSKKVDPCEEFLISLRDSYVDQGIWSSKVVVIDRMLADSLNMKSVYEEIRGKLGDKRRWIRVLEVAIDAALFHNPSASASLRNETKDVMELNGEIASLSRKLVECLELRKQKCEENGIHGTDLRGPVSLIEKAGEEHLVYRSELRHHLVQLSARFQLHHWPAIEDMIYALGRDAGEVGVEVSSSSARDAISSTKHSKRDYLRGFLAELESTAIEPPEFRLPSGFKLTDMNIATLLNACYGRELFDAESVKRARQGIRATRLASE